MKCILKDKENSVYYEEIGITQKDIMHIDKIVKINLNELKESNSCWFNNYFNDKKWL